ncbi:MAG: mechanosensitive ion channel family protein [Cyanobacteria bacterium]|nr:mechanosensitive ion channel family protein [Cyanobacteriota bacterium]
MSNYQELLNQEFFGNTIEQYLYAIGIFIGLLILFRIFRKIILGRLRKIAAATPTHFDDTLVEILDAIHPRFYDLTALYFASHSLILAQFLNKGIRGIFLGLFMIQLINASQKILEYFLIKALKNNQTNEADQMVFSGLSLFIKIGLWAVGILLFLSNMGVNVTSLTASMGIGGIAIALAVQNILGDIFSSFSIYFDKPFAVGDFITVGEHMGTVKKIGMKSTRLEALQGEEIVISNKELTSARVQNFKKMNKRRIPFTIGVTYETSLDKCKQIPEIIKTIFSEVDNADLDRVNFKEFAAYSLNFEIVYYHLSGDYIEYMRIREIINLKIKEEFEKASIDMAFPTQTVIVEKT